jgi:four helix bundle protein
VYKDLEVWKDSISLIKLVYKEIEKLPKEEDYNLKRQLRKAVVSVALNIAEGKCRQSAKDFAHFLNLSIASLNEVNAIFNICEELQFLKDLNELYTKINILSRRLSSLRIKLLKSR